MTENKDTIRLGIIGMGLTNMASTFTLLKDVPDLRYQITSICALPEAAVKQCAETFGIPVCYALQTINDDPRKNAKTYHICKRIELFSYL